MLYLGNHPNAAKIVVMKVPATYPIPQAEIKTATNP
jgi:hypothetical protein